MNRQRQANSRRNGRASNVPRAQEEYQARTRENISALRLVKAFRGPNNKYINPAFGSAITGAPTLTSPGLFCLNQSSQGTGENNRIGRLVRHKWLDLDFGLEVNANSSDSAVVARAYVIVETTALGSALAPQQFFVDNTNFSPYSQRDRTNRNASRYVVLWDSKPFIIGNPFRTNGSTTVVAQGTCPIGKTFSVHLPLNFSTDYSRGNAGTYADIDTNSLWLMVVSDDTASLTTLSGCWTTCFNDDS